VFNHLIQTEAKPTCTLVHCLAFVIRSKHLSNQSLVHNRRPNIGHLVLKYFLTQFQNRIFSLFLTGENKSYIDLFTFIKLSGTAINKFKGDISINVDSGSQPLDIKLFKLILSMKNLLPEPK
jgi:hypothetical protein